ncbi:MAG: hypothetical protein AB1757_02150 [Acidobacteriota bacterium]
MKILFVILFFSVSVFAQAHTVCESAEANAFDFWLGDWVIKQKILKADGSWFKSKAKTKVSRVLNGCAVIEHWEGEVQFFWEGMSRPEKIKALSVRSYDAKTKSWKINWMDTRNPQFSVFEGKFDNGKGEFFRKVANEEGNQTIIRITFSDIKSTSVHWDLAVSSDNGKTFATLWIMEMAKAKKSKG